MRERGEFKISLSNPRGGKILNSATSGREPMGGGGREKNGCFKCGGTVRLSAWNSYLQENFEVI